MHVSNYIYHHNHLELHGHLVYDDLEEAARPAVLVIHDWSGRNEFACQKAEAFAKMGYVGFAVDLYGHGQVGETIAEKQALHTPLMNDRALLLARISAALEALKQLAVVDKRKIMVIGFCFGGLCALDLARSSADIAGVVSIHGLLHKQSDAPELPIKAKILALHGYNDPMVTPTQVNTFCNEMTEAGADWQVHMYGHVKHAFTNPNAHDVELGLMYNATATRRAFQAVSDFLEEVLA